MVDFRNDPVGTVRKSRNTGNLMIRVPEGFKIVHNVAEQKYVFLYPDIGGWNGRPDIWEQLPVRVVR